MRYLVTGGAGFIGSNIVDRLMEEGHEVTVLDNLSSGNENLLSHHMGSKNFKFVKGDLLDLELLDSLLGNFDFVYHLAANPDVRYGVERTRIDLEQGPIATHNLMEAMRKHGVRNMAFSSSSAVYGEAKVMPTPETYGPLFPISLYAASKLACEAMIASYCHSFDMRAVMFRFANVIGSRGTHGVLVDFINKLEKNPTELEILGDGNQKKSYFLVEDCVDAMFTAVEKSKETVDLFNIGCEDWISVTSIARIVTEEMGLEDVAFRYTGGTRGWVGDVPKTWISIEKIKGLNWMPKNNSEQAVRKAVRILLDRP